LRCACSARDVLFHSQANVMLEYTHDEAIEMLTKNKITAEEKLVRRQQSLSALIWYGSDL
jgi:hypothetical protein